MIAIRATSGQKEPRGHRLLYLDSDEIGANCIKLEEVEHVIFPRKHSDRLIFTRAQLHWGLGHLIPAERVKGS